MLRPSSVTCLGDVAPGSDSQTFEPAELVIYDRQGNILARSLKRLPPGRAVALDLKFADHAGIAAVVGNRLEFYAEVRFTKLRGGYVIPSLEVIEDSTGHTVRMVVDFLG